MKAKLVSASLALVVSAMMVLPALAQTSTTPIPSQPPQGSPIPRPSPNLLCMQKAVTGRDNRIISAVDAYHQAVIGALETRLSELVAAWGISNAKARKAALKAAWDKFRSTRKSAAKVLKEQRTAAWNQYRADAKACKTARGGGGAAEETSVGGSEGEDAQL
ncbi:MAG: hypothetical protein HYS57_03210 [Parcubacteria group bacterium]|nr:hypothetical protein [Parcubacteria group bacterium]